MRFRVAPAATARPETKPLRFASTGGSNKAVAATQFTAFMAMGNLATSIANHWQGAAHLENLPITGNAGGA